MKYDLIGISFCAGFFTWLVSEALGAGHPLLFFLLGFTLSVITILHMAVAARHREEGQ